MATADVVTGTKPHISASQMETFCKCPEQYRRRYLENEIIAPGVSLLKGKGFHGGAETNMRQKIESHVDLSASDIQAAAAAAFDAEVHGAYSLTEEEFSRGPDVVLGEAKDDLMDLVAVHAKQQAPDYQPIMVEEKVRIELPNASRDLLGVIDLADDKRRVVDFKTAGKSKSQGDADSSVQLSVYAAAFHAKTGTPPESLRLDTVVQTKTQTKRQVLETERGVDDFGALAQRINVVTLAIEAGVFPPATPMSWWCAPKWCGYHATCPFVQGVGQRRPQGD